MNRARPGGDLVNASAHFLAAQADDHPLDLPPMAKADDIAGIAAALGAHRRLEACIVAEAFDELGGIGQRRPAGDEWGVHGCTITPKDFPDCRQGSSTSR